MSKQSEAAFKSWATRRKNQKLREAEERKKRRSEAAKKAWETRRANADA